MASVVEEALSLPIEKRAELADILLQSLNAPLSEEVQKAWAKEAEARLGGYRASKITAFDMQDALAAIRSQLK